VFLEIGLNFPLIQYPAMLTSTARACRHPLRLENHDTGERMQPATSWQCPAVRHSGDNSSSLCSTRTNAHRPPSNVAGTSLTPRVPVAFALTRSARAITGDRTPISARARLPSRGIITSFPVPISSFHFDVLGWSYALPARGQAIPAQANAFDHTTGR
jgi:hypothetical protein